jgi:hypothetical protein
VIYDAQFHHLIVIFLIFNIQDINSYEIVCVFYDLAAYFNIKFEILDTMV